eukprot:SAG22_NODE_663_length_8042_cov_12.157371_3_plen_70_part_00
MMTMAPCIKHRETYEDAKMLNVENAIIDKQVLYNEAIQKKKKEFIKAGGSKEDAEDQFPSVELESFKFR